MALFRHKVGLAASIVEQQHLTSALCVLRYLYAPSIPSGGYRFSESERTQIEQWVKAGGVIVGQKSALRYFAQHKWLDVKLLVERVLITRSMKANSAIKMALRYTQKVGGAVFEANIDNTHPLFWL